jgi:serine/threonine protein kinase
MVIMEKVEGKMASDLASRGQPLPRSVLDGVQLAIQTLHQANIVFGDLRLPNIMVCQDDNSQARAILVDFDWAAIAGEGRYPASLAPFSVWAPTVHPHGLMQKAHDIHMLEVLEGLCSKIAEN